MNDIKQTDKNAADVLNIGQKVDDIGVQIGVRFLEHFSQQLYSSPNKAFEELVSNSWDAGATSVFIEFPEDPSSDNACICVLDNGESMDASGLHDLWKVAYSPKENNREVNGRPIIGKFGIGKLATYVLANELTYICKADDGVIRIVSMDYRIIDPKKTDLIQDISLELRETSLTEVEKVLKELSVNERVISQIKSGLEPPHPEEWVDEYRSEQAPPPSQSNCWTLVLLSSLKPQGKAIKQGVIRRMMQTSLPLGRELSIVLNNEALGSSKLDREIMKEWVIGTDLDIESFKIPAEPGADEEDASEVHIEKHGDDSMPPHIVLPDIGKVTGTIQVYVDNISGGKSEGIRSSNGFFVNVRGRVINLDDPAFGEKDLSHSVWARFRMTVRADGLDKHLAVNREQFFRNDSLRLFRAFLRRAFNMARVHYEAILQSAWSDLGENLVNSWGTLPLQPLRDVVSNSLESSDGLSPKLLDDEGIEDRQNALESWKQETKEDIGSVLRSVEFEERVAQDRISKYRLKDRTLSINNIHPFVQEHSETPEEKRALRNFILVEFLSDIHALDIGIDPIKLEEIQSFRDSMSRLVAQVDRKSGAQIAKILVTVSTYKDHRALEIIVGDALDYLGFSVERMGNPGQPEGVARAYPTPTSNNEVKNYSFTYDAKSSTSGKVKTGNVGVAGLARHREKHEADHALVVAPEFETGALKEECESNNVTPITTHSLGKLLLLSANYGSISLTKLRELFTLHSPQDTDKWVDELEDWIRARTKLTLDIFFKALEKIEDDIPDAVDAGLLSKHCRDISGNKSIGKYDVTSLARGLQIVIPELIRVDENEIIVSAHPNKIISAVQNQLRDLSTQTNLEFQGQG